MTVLTRTVLRSSPQINKSVMGRIAKKLTDLIGNTPLLELENFNREHDTDATIIAKLEYFNPGGSVKDRIGFSMIEDAEKKD